MKKSKYSLKPAPLVMVMVLLFQVFYPTAALAITTSSGQMESRSFEPVATTQLVDPFTGDFNYNIPLLTVPGPNGGYPVNLSYHAGISPDQEASWVGLGWNINVGAVSRGLRGLPDDFFGSDMIKREQTLKPNWIVGLNGGFNLELAGFEVPDLPATSSLTNAAGAGVGIGVSYNNYKGLNITSGIKSTSDYKVDLFKKGKELSIGFDASFDPQEGPELKVNPTIKDEEKKNEDEEKKKGFIGRFVKKWKDETKKMNNAQEYRSFSFSNDNPSFSPNTSFPEGGFDASIWVKFGASPGLALFPNAMLKGFLFHQHIKDKTLDFPSYGYMFLGERNRVDAGLSPYLSYPTAPIPQGQVRPGMAVSDFSRDNHGVNTYAPNLPVPIHTFDVYSASAQGLGMVFRPHRNDLGLVYDTRNSSDFTDVELGFDLGLGNLFHAGFNPGVSYSSMYSGKWKGQYKDFEKEYEFTNSIFGTNDQTSDDNINIFRDPFFFKSADDKSVSEIDANKYKNDDAVNFEITSFMDVISTSIFSDFDPSKYSLNVFPKIKNQLPGTVDKILTANKNTADDVRDHNVGYRSRFEIVNTVAANTSALSNNIYNTNEFPGITSGAVGSPIDYSLSSDKKGHHIAEYSITNPDGNIYVFGLPVYNVKEKDAVFSIANDNTSDRKVSYTSADASLNNSQGSDNFYSSTQTPAYTTAHLLTAIYSADYVDITGNGPSDDDFGYYIKFNYSTITSSHKFKWRVPYSGAVKLENYKDNDADDKGFYKYGENEIYYLNSIETKTHLAAFELNDPVTTPRLDARGVADELRFNANSPAPDPNVVLRSLQKIKLYSKADPTVPIKTVHFNYDYTLCPNTINSFPQGIQNPNKGKLTLKSLHFTYLNNNKGALSPYEFTYDSFNPSYQELMTDRWGNYKEDATVTGSGVNYLINDFPYVDQDKVKADKYAAAWSLREIKMPSGGKVKIEYEADDYQYVQDKRSMQMFEIAGTGYVDDPSGAIVHSGFDIDREPGFGELHDLIFFNLKSPSNDPTELNKYIADIDKYFYFKANIRLKRLPNINSGQKAYDYVEGYSRLNKAFGIQFDPASAIVIGTTTYYTKACIKVDYQKAVTIVNGDDGKLHPFRKAAFEYMKLKRPELFFPLNNTSSTSGLGAQALYSLINTIMQAGQLLTSYNRFCKIMGYADVMSDGNDSQTSYDSPKSYIRLGIPDGTKYGGGHRVKRIFTDNEWDLNDAQATREYGQEYYYDLTDGTSSGVAEYEPFYGNEENPLKVPEDDYMSDRTFIARLKELYQDKPICEAYYPGANVGYSRVMVKSLTRDFGSGEVNKLSAGGLTVNEFYTSKDFPVKEENKGTDNTSFDKGVTIPFIGKLKLTTAGYSQGFKITLNDMHGKPRATRVYPHNTNFSVGAQAIHEVEYTYSMNGNNLNNKVTGLFNDGVYRDIEIGVDRDFVMDMNQNSQFNIDLGLATNVDASIPVVTTNFVPYLNYTNNCFRTFTNVKAVYRQGILTETKVINDGAVTKTKNLMFDAYSGRPVLTQVNNEFDEPIYTYSMPAHWYYSNMGNKSVYYKYSSNCAYASSGPGITITHGLYFNIGDKVRLSVKSTNTTMYKDYWIKSIAGGVFTLADEKGLPFTGTPAYNQVTLIDPIKKNLLTTDAGKIVSLTNPVTSAQCNFIHSMNSYFTSLPAVPPTTGGFSFKECIEPKIYSVTYTYNTLLNEISFFISPGCRVTLKLPFNINSGNYNQFTYIKGGGNVLMIKDNVTGLMTGTTATLNDPGGCISTCLDGVLHAEAYRFKNDWVYDYQDMGNPFAYIHSSSSFSVNTAVSQNPYKYGKAGIWRLNEKYLYQVDRKQGSPQTDISKDGTYDVFNWHNWVAPGNSGSNTQWSQILEMTKYNPYGFEVENRDWYNMHTSALYGNENKIALATGDNCPYDQLSSQTFENSISGVSIKAGHVSIKDVSAGVLTISGTESHTGFRSLQFGGKKIAVTDLLYSTSPFTTGGNYHIVPGKKYILTAWIKNNSNTNLPLITGPVPITSVNYAKDVVDGWRRMEVEFTFNSLVNNTSYNIDIDALLIPNIFIDDIRIQPFDSQVKAYVYNPVNLNLMADLDDKNYATFYGYDETGVVVNVKKETERGIYTVKKITNNIKRN